MPLANSPVAGLAVFGHRRENVTRTVICVHGGLDRGGSFTRIARRADTLDLVTYDRRGYQGSRALPHPDLAHHTEDLLALAEHERGRRVTVLGHSYGGLIAINAAIAAPHLFHSLVLYEPPLPFVHRRAGWGATPIADNPADEAESFFRRMVSDAGWQRLSEDERAGRRADGPALVDDLRTLRGAAPFDVTQLAVPTWYCHGDQTHAAYYREVGALLADMNPVIHTHEFTHAGHGAHLTSPDQFASLLEDIA